MAPKIDLNALLLFYQTVNAGSINRAARQLEAPKSTISRKLALLEAHFGATLVKRGARRLLLTEIGEAVYARAERIAAELEEADLKAAEMQGGMSGTLRLSMPVFFIGWVSQVIGTFADDNPSVRLEIEAHNRWVDVTEEPFDLAFHFGVPIDSFAPIRRLAELPRSFYASPAYLARHGTPTSPQALASHEAIVHVYQRRDRVWPGMLEGRAAVPRAVVNNAALVHELVGRNIGIGLMPDIMCRGDVAAGRLVRLSIGWEPEPLTVSATFHTRRYATRKARAFVDEIAGHLQRNA